MPLKTCQEIEIESLKATVDMQIMLDNQNQSKQTQNRCREASNRAQFTESVRRCDSHRLI